MRERGHKKLYIGIFFQYQNSWCKWISLSCSEYMDSLCLTCPLWSIRPARKLKAASSLCYQVRTHFRLSCHQSSPNKKLAVGKGDPLLLAFYFRGLSLLSSCQYIQLHTSYLYMARSAAGCTVLMAESLECAMGCVARQYNFSLHDGRGHLVYNWRDLISIIYNKRMILWSSFSIWLVEKPNVSPFNLSSLANVGFPYFQQDAFHDSFVVFLCVPVESLQ